jgi:hypothetical protein
MKSLSIESFPSAERALHLERLPEFAYMSWQERHVVVVGVVVVVVVDDDDDDDDEYGALVER